MNRWTIILALVLLGGALAVACKLDPSKVPPCDPYAVYPDPCAAAPRDAGTDG